MKQSKFLMAGAVALAMFFTACNSGDDEKTTDKTTGTDTTAKKPMEPAKPAMTLIIMHKVANYDKWLPGYEGHDSVRQAYGLHNFVIGRGTPDSNLVLIALHMDDTAKAHQFTMLPGLKERMQKYGVTGAPTFHYLQTDWVDSTTNSSTDRVIVFHKVKDADAWRKSFDSHKQTRMDAGITDRAVGHEMSDKNMVDVVLVISDKKKAEAFFNSKDLKDKMAEGGVIGKPDVFTYHVVKNYQ